MEDGEICYKLAVALARVVMKARSESLSHIDGRSDYSCECGLCRAIIALAALEVKP